MTQYDKVYILFKDGGRKCGNDFRRLFIFSPHKRRKEIEQMGKVHFHWFPCEHGSRAVRDYELIEMSKFDCGEPYLHTDHSGTENRISLQNKANIK